MCFIYLEATLSIGLLWNFIKSVVIQNNMMFGICVLSSCVRRGFYRPADRLIGLLCRATPRRLLEILNHHTWLYGQRLKLEAELLLIQAMLWAQADSLKRWVCPIGHRFRQNLSRKNPESMPPSSPPHASSENLTTKDASQSKERTERH